MGDQRAIRIGVFAGLLWAVFVVFGGIRWAGGAFMPPAIALPGALIAPGLVLAAMVGKSAWLRLADGSSGNVAEIERVLRESIEQAVLAMLIWPFVAVTLGGSIVLYMGFAFALTRLVYWYGRQKSDYLRAFGVAATFSPTVLAGIWVLVVWV
ncbi:MAG: MAPEG family protein [Arenibacterium sp.]